MVETESVWIITACIGRRSCGRSCGSCGGSCWWPCPTKKRWKQTIQIILRGLCHNMLRHSHYTFIVMLNKLGILWHFSLPKPCLKNEMYKLQILLFGFLTLSTCCVSSCMASLSLAFSPLMFSMSVAVMPERVLLRCLRLVSRAVIVDFSSLRCCSQSWMSNKSRSLCWRWYSSNAENNNTKIILSMLLLDWAFYVF